MIKSGSPFTMVAKLFFTCKNLYFVNDEVRAVCPKLGHTAALLKNFLIIINV